jgi:hypothetical protein
MLLAALLRDWRPFTWRTLESNQPCRRPRFYRPFPCLWGHSAMGWATRVELASSGLTTRCSAFELRLPWTHLGSNQGPAGCGPAARTAELYVLVLRALKGTRTPNRLLRRQLLYPLSYQRVSYSVLPSSQGGSGACGTSGLKQAADPLASAHAPSGPAVIAAAQCRHRTCPGTIT